MIFGGEGMAKGGVGFFDSGVGGLSVLLECREALNGVPVYYYGDNQRAPYGNRSIIEVRAHVHEAFLLFERLQARAVVVACNTVTAWMIDELRSRYSFPIVGVEPAVRPAAAGGGRVLLLATKATCESERLGKILRQTRAEFPEAEICVHPCPNLAMEIEQGYDPKLGGRKWLNVSAQLPPMQVDSVVLGCTHYSLVKEEIAAFYRAKVFDGNEGVARRLKTILKSYATLADGFAEKTSEKSEKAVNLDHFCLKLSLLSSLPRFSLKKGEKKRAFRLRKNFFASALKNASILYFLGSGRAKNRLFCEHMFGFR